VAITASKLDEDRERARAVGIDAYLIKPLDRQRLAALLERGGRDEAARLAHTLAGSARSLGAARLADAVME